VIDPSFGGEQLTAAAARYGFAAEWQPPIELPLERIPAEAPEGAVWEWEHFCAEHDPQQLKYLWRMTVA